MKVTKQYLFGNIDFNSITQDSDFKEDSVREVIILPILKQLGYEQQNIVRSKSLAHPYLKVGSNKKIALKLVPDYILKGSSIPVNVNPPQIANTNAKIIKHCMINPFLNPL